MKKSKQKVLNFLGIELDQVATAPQLQSMSKHGRDITIQEEACIQLGLRNAQLKLLLGHQ